MECGAAATGAGKSDERVQVGVHGQRLPGDVAPERRGETIVIDVATARKRLERFDGIAPRDQ